MSIIKYELYKNSKCTNMTKDKDNMYLGSEDVQKILSSTPQKHESLPDDLIVRIINFKKIIGDVEVTTIEQTIQNFKHDTHPEREVAIWEWIANFYKQINKLYLNLTLDQQKEVLGVLLHFSSGIRELDRFDWIKVLPDEVLKKMFDLVSTNKDYILPISVCATSHNVSTEE